MDTDFDIDCPWCAGHMVSAEVATRDAGEALACPTCSIVVEFAPDPIGVPLAAAA